MSPLRIILCVTRYGLRRGRDGALAHPSHPRFLWNSPTCLYSGQFPSCCCMTQTRRASSLTLSQQLPCVRSWPLRISLLEPSDKAPHLPLLPGHLQAAPPPAPYPQTRAPSNTLHAKDLRRSQPHPGSGFLAPLLRLLGFALKCKFVSDQGRSQFYGI